MRALYYGDNLEILREYIPAESIDLIYLDPPFNSNRSYNVLFKDESGQEAESQITAFEDTWHWGEDANRTYHNLVHNSPPRISRMVSALHDFIGTNQMMAYLTMMTARLIELHRVLKPTGSIYLHCDPTASHYLKVVMDTIFDVENFRNEVVWKRTTAHSGAKRWGDVHDTILFFTKSSSFVWNDVFQEYDEKYLGSKYRHEDERGIYRLDNLTGAGTTGGDSGKEWRGYDPGAIGRHWAVPTGLVEDLIGKQESKQLTSQEKLDLLDAHGYIYISDKGRGGGPSFPQFKRYIGKGVPIQGVIDDISPINSQAQERLGYPTQKPLALLERIIQASSNEGDIVLDPFCGCGTAIVAAETLNREWMGIDITSLSTSLLKYRLKDSFGLIEKKDYDVVGEPKSLSDAIQLAKDNRYQFQWWAAGLVQAKPLGGESGSREGKKGSDKGVDAVISFIDEREKTQRIIVQVKSGHVSSRDIRDLRGVLEREGAAIGVFITLEQPSKDMTTEAVSSGYYYSQVWGKDYPRIQILTIEDLLEGREVDMPPDKARKTFKRAKRITKKGTPQQSERDARQDELF